MPKKDILFQPEGSGSGEGGGGSEGEGSQGGDGGAQGGTGGDGEPPAGDGESQEGDAKDQMVPAAKLKEVNKEAQALRKRLRDAEKERDELKSSQMSEQEKVTKERDELKESVATLEAQTRDLTVQVLASKKGIVDPQAASKLLDWSKIEDPSDESAVEEALADLVKEKPYLTGNMAGGGDGGSGDGGTGGPTNMNDLLRGAR